VPSPLRYRLLEAPRALALEQLHAAGEFDAALWRLAQALAEVADDHLRVERGGVSDPRRDPGLAWRLPAQADQFAAFGAALAQPDLAGARLAARLATLVGPAAIAQPTEQRLAWAQALRERAALLASDRAEAGDPGAAPDPALRARALDGAATLVRHSDLAARGADLQAAAQAWRAAGDRVGEFCALARATDSLAMTGRHAEAQALLERVRELDDPSWPPLNRRWRWFAEGVAAVCAGDLPRATQAWRNQLALVGEWDHERMQALHSLANAEQIAGDAAAARPRLREAVAIARRQHRRSTLHAFLLPNLVAAEVVLGDLAAARAAAAEGWPHAAAADAQPWWADHLALLAAREGRLRSAARLLGLADAGYARLKDSRQALESQAVAAAEAEARAGLGDAAFEALRAEGADAGSEPLLAAEALSHEDGPPSRR
jgi:hypothetical protein